MKITPVKLPLLQPPKDNLFAAIDNSKLKLDNNSILAVSSKAVAIHQGRCVSSGDIINKDDLIKKEAEMYLERDVVPEGYIMHTVKYHMLVGSAGVDESNANGHYILLPENQVQFAEDLGMFIINKFKIKNVGIIITDSHSVPMRRGTVGISIASFGFKPIYDYCGQADLFNRELKVSISNLADGLAAAATVVMGEGNEQTPLAVISDLNNVQFIDHTYKPKGEQESYYVDTKHDLYRPFFDYLPWKKGESSKDSKNS